MAGYTLGKLWLGDRCHRATVLGVVRQLVVCGAGVGGHRHRAQPAAGIPGQQGLGAVVEMDQHPVAGEHAAPRQATRDATDLVVEAGIGPGLGWALEGLPDDERMVGPGLGAVRQQRGHVQATEGVEVGTREQGRHGG